MFDARRTTTTESDWEGVSATRPCPVCGENAGCRMHANASFACCSRQPSDWPMTNGAWLHRVVLLVAPDLSRARRA
jgi:hypothetical protein